MEKIRIPKHLYEFVKKKVDLGEFIEKEIGCNIRWYEQGVSGGILCPMPNHKDSKPSFRIKFVKEEGFWIYNCLGCGSHGTIINFFMDYYDIPESSEAVLAICSKFGFDKDQKIKIIHIDDIKKKIDINKKMECTHLLTSNLCRMLLKKNYDVNSKWVATVYKEMNRALDENNIEVIEKIGSQVHKRMRENIV